MGKRDATHAGRSGDPPRKMLGTVCKRQVALFSETRIGVEVSW